MFASPATAQEKSTPSKIEIYLGKYYSPNDGKLYSIDGRSYALKKKTDIEVIRSSIMPDPNNSSLYEVDFRTSDFSKEKDFFYFLKCGDKVFQILSMGGNKDSMFMVSLQALTQETAEFLTGQTMAMPPKEDLQITYDTDKAYSPDSEISVSILITNSGKKDLSVYWGTLGDGHAKYKDAQLKFSATLNGKPVNATPYPVPDGFISSPHLFRPNTALRTNAHLADWLDFTKPGIYHVNAIYTLEIQNPNGKSDAIKSWKVNYQNQFDIHVTGK